VEWRPQCGWSSTNISPLLKGLNHSYTSVLPTDLSLKASIEYTNVSVYNTTIYFIYFKMVYRQGDIFRPSLGHPQALKENRSKTT
jgi:hypothetical protein